MNKWRFFLLLKKHLRDILSRLLTFLYIFYLTVFFCFSKEFHIPDFIALTVIYLSAILAYFLFRNASILVPLKREYSINSREEAGRPDRETEFITSNSWIFLFLIFISSVYIYLMWPVALAGVSESPRTLMGYRHQDEFFSKNLYGKMLDRVTLDYSGSAYAAGSAHVNFSLLPLFPFRALIDDPATTALAAARLSAMFSGLALSLLAFFLGYLEYGFFTGFLTCLFMITSSRLMQWSSFANSPDIMSSFFISLSIISLECSIRKKSSKFLILSFFLSGIAFGVKFMGTASFLLSVIAWLFLRKKTGSMKAFSVIFLSFLCGILFSAPYLVINPRPIIFFAYVVLTVYMRPGWGAIEWSPLAPWKPFFDCSLFDIAVIGSGFAAVFFRLFSLSATLSGRLFHKVFSWFPVNGLHKGPAFDFWVLIWSFYISFMVKSGQSERLVFPVLPFLAVRGFSFLLEIPDFLFHFFSKARLRHPSTHSCAASSSPSFLSLFPAVIFLVYSFCHAPNAPLSFNFNSGRLTDLLTWYRNLLGPSGGTEILAHRLSVLTEVLREKNIPENAWIVTNTNKYIVPDTYENFLWGAVGLNPTCLARADILAVADEWDSTILRRLETNRNNLRIEENDILYTYRALANNSYPHYSPIASLPPPFPGKVYSHDRGLLHGRKIIIHSSSRFLPSPHSPEDLFSSTSDVMTFAMAAIPGEAFIEFSVQDAKLEEEFQEIEIVWSASTQYARDFSIFMRSSPSEKWVSIVHEKNWGQESLTEQKNMAQDKRCSSENKLFPGPVYYRKILNKPVSLANIFRIECHSYSGFPGMIIRSLAFYPPEKP